MEEWRKVWRDGVAPLLNRDHLIALRDALKEDSPKIIQGATTVPPPLWELRYCTVEAACALSYCGWIGDELDTVAAVEEFFARLCFDIDQRMGSPAACRWFLNWFDETPRPLVISELLPEVLFALEGKSHAPSQVP